MKATIGSEIQGIKSTLDTLLKMKLNQRSDYWNSNLNDKERISSVKKMIKI